MIWCSGIEVPQTFDPKCRTLPLLFLWAWIETETLRVCWNIGEPQLVPFVRNQEFSLALPRSQIWRFEAYFHLDDSYQECLLTECLQFVSCPLMVCCNQIWLILGGSLIWRESWSHHHPITPHIQREAWNKLNAMMSLMESSLNCLICLTPLFRFYAQPLTAIEIPSTFYWR